MTFASWTSLVIMLGSTLACARAESTDAADPTEERHRLAIKLARQACSSMSNNAPLNDTLELMAKATQQDERWAKLYDAFSEYSVGPLILPQWERSGDPIQDPLTAESVERDRIAELERIITDECRKASA